MKLFACRRNQPLPHRRRFRWGALGHKTRRAQLQDCAPQAQAPPRRTSWKQEPLSFGDSRHSLQLAPHAVKMICGSDASPPSSQPRLEGSIAVPPHTLRGETPLNAQKSQRTISKSDRTHFVPHDDALFDVRGVCGGGKVTIHRHPKLPSIRTCSRRVELAIAASFKSRWTQ